MALSPRLLFSSPRVNDAGTASSNTETTSAAAHLAPRVVSLGSSSSAAESADRSPRGSPQMFPATGSQGSPKVAMASWKQTSLRVPSFGMSGSSRSGAEDASASSVEKREAAGASTKTRARANPAPAVLPAASDAQMPREPSSFNSPEKSAVSSPSRSAATAAASSPGAASDEAAKASNSDVHMEDVASVRSKSSVRSKTSGVPVSRQNTSISREGSRNDPFEVPKEMESKDEDVVELPSLHATSQASFMNNSQAGRTGSRTSKLSPGDLMALRVMAVEAAADPMELPSKAQASSLGMLGSAQISAPVKAPAANAEDSAAALSAAQQVIGEVQSGELGGPGPPFGGSQPAVRQYNQPTPLKVPSEDSADPIPEMHSSSTVLQPAMVPSMLFRTYQSMDQASNRNAAQKPSGQLVRREDSGQPLRDPLRTHGTGTTPNSVGFLEAGPFWTCGSTPHCRAASRRTNSAAQMMLGDVFRKSSSSVDISSRISSVLCNCINLVSKAVDVTPDPEPPEDELTTVFMETKEQRLQWRDFLSEAVSKCKANALFQSYDVEADPPRYMRPPPSMAPKVDSAVRCYRQAGMQTPPHIVAPKGAGWSPIPSRGEPDGPGGEHCENLGSGAGALASSSSSSAGGSLSLPSRTQVVGPSLSQTGGDTDIVPTPNCTPAPTRPGEDAAPTLGGPAGASPTASSVPPPQRTESLLSAGEALTCTSSSAQSVAVPSPSRSTVGSQQPPSTGKASPEASSPTSHLSPSTTSRSPRSSASFMSKGVAVALGRRPPPAG